MDSENLKRIIEKRLEAGEDLDRIKEIAMIKAQPSEQVNKILRELMGEETEHEVSLRKAAREYEQEHQRRERRFLHQKKLESERNYINQIHFRIDDEMYLKLQRYKPMSRACRKGLQLFFKQEEDEKKKQEEEENEY